MLFVFVLSCSVSSLVAVHTLPVLLVGYIAPEAAPTWDYHSLLKPTVPIIISRRNSSSVVVHLGSRSKVYIVNHAGMIDITTTTVNSTILMGLNSPRYISSRDGRYQRTCRDSDISGMKRLLHDDSARGYRMLGLSIREQGWNCDNGGRFRWYLA